MSVRKGVTQSSRMEVSKMNVADVLPRGWRENLLDFFGSGEPSYSKILVIAETNPYGSLRNRVESSFGPIEDLTDFNSDLGWVWWFRCNDQILSLRLSFVGEFALLLDSQKRPVSVPQVLDLLVNEGLVVLSREQLEVTIDLWGPEFEAPLYEYLFQYDTELPWLMDVPDEVPASVSPKRVASLFEQPENF
jgi:hypothetical protein